MSKTVALGGLSFAIKKVSPQAAKLMLQNRSRNRAIKKSRIAKLRRSIIRGEWNIAQPLMFDADGALIDGQHRLHAVIESNRTVDFLVVRGYPVGTTFGKLDDISPRSLKDWFEIEGEAHSDTLAGVVRMALRKSRGLVPTEGGGSFSWTSIEGVEFLEDHPEIRQSVNRAPGSVSTLMTRKLACYAHWEFAKMDRTLADDFFIELVTGPPADGDPLYVLRERLKSNHNAKAKMGRTEVLALTYKTWNAIRAGKKMHSLKWGGGGKEKKEAFPVLS